LQEPPEPLRRAARPISVSERPSVSGRANLAVSGSVRFFDAFSML